MATIIKFKGHYNASDFTNQQIINVFRTCDPDVDLIASNGKIVPAHRVILAMYSKYLRRILSLSNPEEKFIVPLIAYPMIAIQHVVELFYYGETRVLTSFKGQVFKTLDFLEVDYDNPSAHRAVPTTVTPTQQVIKPIEANKATASQVNGKVVSTKSMQVQNKSKPEQQSKQIDIAQPKPDQNVNSTAEKSNDSSTLPMKTPLDAPLDKTTPLCLENNQLTIQPIQTETMQISQNVEPPPLPESSSDNSMPISNELPKEATAHKPATEVEKVNENFAALLVDYDVDKAAKQIHLQVDALLKEMEANMEDDEHTDDMDFD